VPLKHPKQFRPVELTQGEDMTNKIAIITGGSRGLGRNTATNLIFSAEWMSSSRIARTRKKRTG
jgi:hypothetical protein